MEKLEKFRNSPRKVLGDETIKKIWDECDDVMSETMLLSDIYHNVPADIDCHINVFTIHSYPDEKRDAIMRWVDRADLMAVDWSDAVDG